MAIDDVLKNIAAPPGVTQKDIATWAAAIAGGWAATKMNPANTISGQDDSDAAAVASVKLAVAIAIAASMVPTS